MQIQNVCFDRSHCTINDIIGASVSEPHLALLLDKCQSACVWLYCMLSARTKPMYKRACIGWLKHLYKPVTTGILSILECLKVQVLQSVVF